MKIIEILKNMAISLDTKTLHNKDIEHRRLEMIKLIELFGPQRVHNGRCEETIRHSHWNHLAGMQRMIAMIESVYDWGRSPFSINGWSEQRRRYLWFRFFFQLLPMNGDYVFVFYRCRSGLFCRCCWPLLSLLLQSQRRSCCIIIHVAADVVVVLNLSIERISLWENNK